MASKQASSYGRADGEHSTGIVVLALAAVTGLSVSGQTQREWRDYAGGPDSSRFVAATQITKANVGQLQVAWTYPPARPTSIRSSSRGVVYGRGPQRRSSRSTPRPARRSGSTTAFKASTCAA